MGRAVLWFVGIVMVLAFIGSQMEPEDEESAAVPSASPSPSQTGPKVDAPGDLDPADQVELVAYGAWLEELNAVTIPDTYDADGEYLRFEDLEEAADTYPGTNQEIPELLDDASNDLQYGFSSLDHDSDSSREDVERRFEDATAALSDVHDAVIGELAARERRSGYQLAAGGVTDDATSEGSAQIVRWIDGDTVVTSRGTVRLIGIDTPEVSDRCAAADAATAAAEEFAPRGSTITLVNPTSVDDTDKYDRLLRYVVIRGNDIGYSLLLNDLGRARYDGTDGYDWHPHQSAYRATGADVEDETGCVVQEDEASGLWLVAAAAAANEDDDAHWRIDLFDGLERTYLHSGDRLNSAREAAAAFHKAEADAKEKAAADAEAKRKQQQSKSSSGSGSKSSSGSNSKSGGSGSKSNSNNSTSNFNPDTYTGCRAYAPGGKTWKPIPCP